MKVCRDCKEMKPLADFHKHGKTKDGAQSYCKSCDKHRATRRYLEKRSEILLANKKWREENAEKMREYARKWRDENRSRHNESANRRRQANIETYRASVNRWRRANPDKEKESARKYRENNAAKVSASLRRWRLKNIEHVKAKDRLHAQKNRAQRAAATRARDAAKLQATPAWANKAKIAEFYFAADFLGMVTGIWHHVDHIVPLRSNVVCGLHCEINLQVLTASENSAKGNRFWPDMPTK